MRFSEKISSFKEFRNQFIVVNSIEKTHLSFHFLVKTLEAWNLTTEHVNNTRNSETEFFKFSEKFINLRNSETGFLKCSEKHS